MMAGLPETPLFFSNGQSRLFGILHEPMPRHHMGVVLCHPFGEEKLWSHRVFVTFARALAAEGYHVLRFDYRGNGDSDGDFAESSVETALEDISTAIDLLKERTGVVSVCLVGLRLGATLAGAAAEGRSDIARLVLWAPIVDGNRYMQELLRVNLTTQMAVYRAIRADRQQLVEQLREGALVNVDGYDISHAMFQEVSRLNMAGAPSRFDGPCLIVQVDRTASHSPAGEVQRLRSCYRNAELQIVQELPFWRETDRFFDAVPELFDRTLRWMGP
jgi:exosortase A-associated hydrolase 2